MTTPTNKDAASVFFAFTRVIKSAIQASSTATCSFLQMKTLSYVKEQGEPTMGDIAYELRASSPAVTAIIDKLVETNDLERITDLNDRRIIKLRLTKSGKETLDKSMKAVHKNIQNKLSVLSDSEQKDLINILQKLIINQ